MVLGQEAETGSVPAVAVEPAGTAQPPPPRTGAAPTPGAPDASGALAEERAHHTALYRRLDALRAETRTALAEVLRRSTARNRQNRVERDVSADELQRRAARLDSVDSGLCFGRTDATDGEVRYIGRIGLRDADREPLLIDWRAPASRPFYAATHADPAGLLRRRHLQSRGRELTGADDEVFDLDGMSEQARRGLVGEAVLLASLRRARTGRMSDVVATIQSEQDRVIRHGLPGVLIVQGGPGTGKTVAALHRAAYLLYTHRDVLERRGVLVVGPNPTFLCYIDQVLPSLGETDVVMATLGELYPGVRTDRDEPDPERAVRKGGADAARLLAEAVRARQRLPAGNAVEVRLEHVNPALLLTVRATRAQVAAARDRARGSGLPHNAARRVFGTALLDALADDQAGRLDFPLDDGERPRARTELLEDPGVRAALDALWPQLTPRALLAALYRADGGPLAHPGWDGRWTVADVPLLDELAELLGADDAAERAAEAARRAERSAREGDERYAQGVLDLTGTAELPGMTSGLLADRHEDDTARRVSTADRAAADREWAYGHVIVDEAQELSAMAWRMVMRRIPTRSMTLVGDTAQTGDPAGATSWSEMLDRYAPPARRREERLRVNYRTPAEIMDLAADVLAAAAPGEEAPESVRREGVRPRAIRAEHGRLTAATACAVAEELAGMAADGGGRLAVIAPGARIAELTAVLPAPADDDVLDAPAALLTVGQAKGLEFDRVVVADPAGILAGSPRGGRDLYVAVTRATRRLTVTHEGPLPEPLRRLDG